MKEFNYEQFKKDLMESEMVVSVTKKGDKVTIVPRQDRQYLNQDILFNILPEINKIEYFQFLILHSCSYCNGQVYNSKYKILTGHEDEDNKDYEEILKHEQEYLMLLDLRIA